MSAVRIVGAVDARGYRSCADCLTALLRSPGCSGRSLWATDGDVPVWSDEPLASAECDDCGEPLQSSRAAVAFPLAAGPRLALVLWGRELYRHPAGAPLMPDGSMGGMRWECRAAHALDHAAVVFPGGLEPEVRSILEWAAHRFGPVTGGAR